MRTSICENSTRKVTWSSASHVTPHCRTNAKPESAYHGRHLNDRRTPDCVEKVLFWSETPELAARFRVVAIGEAANLNDATIPVARHATAWFICLLPDMNRLPILRRFCAVAAILNSSWAPL